MIIPAGTLQKCLPFLQKGTPMKKHLLKTTAAALSAVLMLSGCARAPEPPEFDPDKCDIKMTLSQLYSKNNDDAMLKDHENFYVIVNLLGDRYTEYGYYRTKDTFFYEYFKPKTRVHNVDLFYNGTRWYMDYAEDYSPILENRWYAMSDDEMQSMIFSGELMTPVDPDTPEKERVFGIELNEKGYVEMFTTESRDVVKKIMEDTGRSGMQYNGARYDHKYTFDKETGELIYRSDYLTLASGKIRKCFDIEVLYDTNIPDFLKAVTMMIEETLSRESEKTVTLTAVYDDGQTFTRE